MAKIKLVIRPEKANQNGECLVFAKYTHYSKNLYHSTQVQVPIKDFDRQRQLIRKTFSGATTANQLLFKTKAKINEIVMKLQLEDIDPICEVVKERLLEGQKKRIKDCSYFTYEDEYCEYKSKIERVEDSTIRQYKTSFNFMREFEKFYGKSLMFDISLNLCRPYHFNLCHLYH